MECLPWKCNLLSFILVNKISSRPGVDIHFGHVFTLLQLIWMLNGMVRNSDNDGIILRTFIVHFCFKGGLRVLISYNFQNKVIFLMIIYCLISWKCALYFIKLGFFISWTHFKHYFGVEDIEYRTHSKLMLIILAVQVTYRFQNYVVVWISCNNNQTDILYVCFD